MWELQDRHTATVVVAAVVAGLWAAGSVVLAERRPSGRISPVVAAIALGIAGSSHGWAVASAALPGLLAVLLVVTPDGRVTPRSGWVVIGAAAVGWAVAALTVGSLTGGTRTAALAVEWAVLGSVGALGYLARCRAAGPLERARLQWLGWAIVVAGTISLAALGLDAIVGFPHRPGLVALAVTTLVPFALVAGTFDAATRQVDRLLVRTIVVAGIVALVEATYLLVVIGLGHVPTTSDRKVLTSSMLAAAIAALLSIPARHRLEEAANQRVYGDRRAPDEPLRTFAGRMSRAVPLDELLLQLAESLRKSLGLSSAEVWTGADGVLDLVASVPHRDAPRILLSADELTVVARSHVSGHAWVQIWIPALLAGRDAGPIRVASVTHLGQLLGLIVVERAADGARSLKPTTAACPTWPGRSGWPCTTSSSTRLSRRHSTSCATGTGSCGRRGPASSPRRTTHGARSSATCTTAPSSTWWPWPSNSAWPAGCSRPIRARPEKMLEELRADVQDTLSELRELAHGIYPPLLRDRGLAEALQTAANRATLPTSVEADGIGRYAEGIETAVYFCCLEAMQNAGKHAGEGAEVTVRVTVESPGPSEPELLFSVCDDGAGFDPAVVRARAWLREHARPAGGHRRHAQGDLGPGLGHNCRRKDPPGGDGRHH